MLPLGVLLISLALCADAAIGNVQEKAMKLHNGSNSEMVLHLSTTKKKKKVIFDALFPLHDFRTIVRSATTFCFPPNNQGEAVVHSNWLSG